MVCGISITGWGEVITGGGEEGGHLEGEGLPAGKALVIPQEPGVNLGIRG